VDDMKAVKYAQTLFEIPLKALWIDLYLVFSGFAFLQVKLYGVLIYN
jgi:hypothetical protein